MIKAGNKWSELIDKEGFSGIIEDVIMIVVAVINLVFIIFDWSFGFFSFRNFIQSVSYDSFVYYRDKIHPSFLLYDSFFVIIFVAELLIRWLIANRNKTYGKWWFYPFIHWYDVLGCIPLGAFIWLRLIRILAITIRLQKMGVIHLRRTYLYKQFYEAYQTFVQEVSNRALAKLVESLQRGLKKENNGSIIVDAIKPDQSELAKLSAALIQKAVENNYRKHRENMEEQIERAIKDGFESSKEMKILGQLPLVGKRIVGRLENSLNDISFQLADGFSSKLASDKVALIVESIINTSLDSIMKENIELKAKTESKKELHVILKDIVDRILQKLKDDIDSDSKKIRYIPEPEEDVNPLQGSNGNRQ